MTILDHPPAAASVRRPPAARRAVGAVGAVALWAVEAVVAVALVLFIAGIVAAPFVAGWLVGRDQHDDSGWAAASADGPLLLLPSGGEAALLAPGGPFGEGCRVTAAVPVIRLTLPHRTAYRIVGSPAAVACRVGVADAGLLLEFTGTPPTGPMPPLPAPAH